MADHTVRLYALAATIAVFFLTWAIVAARPWVGSEEPTPAAAEPRAVLLAAAERRVAAKRAELDRLLGVAPEDVSPAGSVEIVAAAPATRSTSS